MHGYISDIGHIHCCLIVNAQVAQTKEIGNPAAHWATIGKGLPLSRRGSSSRTLWLKVAIGVCILQHTTGTIS